MEETPRGTPVGVDDPYEHVERCDHLTDEGRCRFALERPAADPEFTHTLRSAEYRCPVIEPTRDWSWADCPNFRSRSTADDCIRCGLHERRNAHESEQPLIEEHHLSYADGTSSHEITVSLCRWCHATVHNSWGRIDDDVNPDPSAIAERERRRSREIDEMAFGTARDRFWSESSE